jgi:hypothetical protein
MFKNDMKKITLASSLCLLAATTAYGGIIKIKNINNKPYYMNEDYMQDVETITVWNKPCGQIGGKKISVNENVRPNDIITVDKDGINTNVCVVFELYDFHQSTSLLSGCYTQKYAIGGYLSNGKADPNSKLEVKTVNCDTLQ